MIERNPLLLHVRKYIDLPIFVWRIENELSIPVSSMCDRGIGSLVRHVTKERYRREVGFWRAK
jgi:hypothetical protein